MEKSNIIVNSNVFLCKTDDPRRDPLFTQQIQDYSRLKEIYDRGMVENGVVTYTNKQKEIVKTELRCIYAKNDPCWGYVDEEHKVVSKCINTRCPRIKKCNKDFSEKEASYWQGLKGELEDYKEPKKLPLYYLVDMVSENEMMRYEVDPGVEGRIYSTAAKNPVLDDEQESLEDETKTRYNPITGKKETIIGFRFKITDTSDYQTERFVPVWGSVEEIEEVKCTPIKKARRLSELEDIKDKKENKAIHQKKVVSCELDSARKSELEKMVRNNVMNQVKMVNLESDDFDTEDIVILFDNPAEMGYVSRMLSTNEVIHGYEKASRVQLLLIEHLNKDVLSRKVLITSTVLSSGCKLESVNAWELLSKKEQISELVFPNKDFYKFTYNGSLVRWCCRNLYDVTHICIQISDFDEIQYSKQSLEEIRLIRKENYYEVFDSSHKYIGVTGKKLMELFNALKDAGEISEYPDEIEGISISVKDQEVSVLGMGHLKFMGY